MRNFRFSMLALLCLSLLAGCSGTEVQEADISAFQAGGFRYYTWRHQPLENTTGSADPIYTLDPMVRAAVDRNLQQRGFVMDPERAQFSVDYVMAEGILIGEKSEVAYTITTLPGRVNRNLNQAEIDNANALAGVMETANVAILFHDAEGKELIWQVVIKKIIDDANAGPESLKRNVDKVVNKGLRNLPNAA